MRKLFKTTLSLIFGIGLFFVFNFPVLAQETKPIFFYGQGCPHCAKVESFLETNQLKDKVIWKEIYHHPQTAQEFNQLADKLNIPLNKRGVPFLYFPQTQTYLVGDKPIIDYLEKDLTLTSPTPSPKTLSPEKTSILTLPLLIGAALADAINPCALAVLLILMTTAIASGKKRRALLSGLAFTTAIFLSYLAMGLGLYHALNYFSLSQSLYHLVAYLALLLGLLNLKDFFWYGKGFRMEVPLSWRPKLKSLLYSVTGPVGAFLIAFLISLFLLPCTSGPYLVVIGMLSHKTTFNLAFRYLIVYNLVFVSPMLLITFGTYFGLNLKQAEKLRSQHLHLLHLITAIILLVLGFLILS